MGLQDSVMYAVRGVIDRTRRDAIVYASCAVLALGALVLATWAAVLSLIPMVGAVYALLIVAGIYMLVMLGALLWLQRLKAKQKIGSAPWHVSSDTTQAHRQAQFAQIAMIVEALMLGYSLSRRR